MFRSYLMLGALLSLAATIGCSSDGGGSGDGGTGGGGGGDGGSGGTSPTAADGNTTLGCTNSFTSDISILDWILSVDPGDAVEPGEEFTAEVSGTAFFDEAFLDAVIDTIDGIQRFALVDLQGTVVVRTGATGDPVALGAADVPYSCALLDESGDPVSCNPDDGDCDGNPANPCSQFVDLPLSDDCSEGGVCDMLGKNEGEDAEAPGNQCAKNGYCLTGPLPLPLETKTATYTANADRFADSVRLAGRRHRRRGGRGRRVLRLGQSMRPERGR